MTFESTAFNMAEPKEYFINPCCFGDDLAKWLIDELRKKGSETDDEPGQEDFGWYLNFETAGIAHCFVIGHRPTGESVGHGLALSSEIVVFLVHYWRRKRGIQPLR